MTHTPSTAIFAGTVATLLVSCGNGSVERSHGSGAVAGTSADSGGSGGLVGTGGHGGVDGTSGSSSNVMMTAGMAGSGTPGRGGASSGGNTGASAGGSPSPAGASGSAGKGASGMPGSSGASSTSGTLSLTIEANPNSVLSCYVSWKTDAPSNSVVDFGVAGYQWEISDDKQVTEHRVLVIGMHAAQTYAIKASSGSQSGEGTFMTGQLPAAIPVGKVMINDKTRSQAGWTLMNVEVGGTDNRPRSADPPAAVIYDADGQPVWYFIDGPGVDIGGAVSTQLTDTGVVIGPTWNQNNTNGVPPREVDFGGNIIWECKHAACLPGANVSHHAAKLPNGHYVILEYVTKGSLQNPVFRELDADSKEVWSLDYATLVPPPAGSSGDWCHGNSITINADKNEVYANCRWVGLLKTTYQSPTYQWLIPASYGSKGLGDFTYAPAESQFSDSHDPEFHDDDSTVMFYDNGGWSGSVTGDTSQYHSRAIEYKIDATAKTATPDFEFPGKFAVTDTWYTTQWYSPFWGDVDRLANGNVLITGGEIGPGKESRVFEVTKADGQIVWEFRFPTNFGVYRSDRVVPPLVHALAN